MIRVFEDLVPESTFGEFVVWVTEDPNGVVGRTYCAYNCILSEFYASLTGNPVTVSDKIYYGDEDQGGKANGGSPKQVIRVMRH